MTAWEAWRSACALDLTPLPEREQLISFLARRFHRGVDKAGAGVPHRRVPGDTDCAALFESWCALHPRKDGKVYKRWLFGRGDRTQGAVESGVSLLMRKVVREWLRTEMPQAGAVSLQQPMTAQGWTLEDLLPQESPAGESPEEAEWRQAFLRELRPEISVAQWVGLQARHAGIPLRDPAVLAAAGEGRSALSKHYRELVMHIAARVRRDFTDLAPGEATWICLRCLEDLAAERKIQIFADKTSPAGCKEAKETL